MGLEPWMTGEPRFDLLVLVGGVVVLDQVDVEILGRLTIDLLQEPQPFDVRVALLGARDQFALQRIESCEQRHRAVARVIVRHRARPPRCERQPELGALQGLALALLVAAQH